MILVTKVRNFSEPCKNEVRKEVAAVPRSDGGPDRGTTGRDRQRQGYRHSLINFISFSSPSPDRSEAVRIVAFLSMILPRGVFIILNEG